MASNGIDILVVDDEEAWRDILSYYAEPYGLTIRTFESGWEAIHYLRGLPSWDMPKAYFVDMRTGDDHNDRASEAELESPLEIFWRAKAKGADKYFRFLTGHYSDHDAHVKGITNAQVILKGEKGANGKIKQVLEAVSAEKQYSHNPGA
ncbi:response regulator [Candidatus Woesearchaeota archaeon]|nr:response regulator [Candidatus Woesearchaeota archaeon]